MKQLLSTILACTLALASPRSSLAADTPISLGPLAGTANSVLIDPDNDLVQLATIYTDGLQRSTDGGQSFEPFGTGLPSGVNYRQLVSDPKNHDRVLLIAGDEVWHSLDFGQTWTSLGLVDSGLRKLAVASASADIFAASGTALFRSSDNGLTWSAVATGVLINEVAISPSDPMRVLYGSINGLFLSTDGGASFAATGLTSWTKAAIFKPTDANLIVASTSSSLWQSTDGGANFTAVTSGLPSFTSAQFFAYAPGGLLWVGLLDGMWGSQNDGASWFAANQGFTNPPPIPTDISFDSNGDTFISSEASGGGIWRTVGQQLPWVHIAFPNHAIYAVAFAGTTRVVGSYDGVFAGTTAVSSTSWQSDFGTHTEAILPDASDPTRWITGGVGSFVDNAQVVVLSGGGTTFTKPYENFGAGRVVTLERDPANPSHLLAGVFPGSFGAPAILASNDSGASWSGITGTTGWANRAITFDPFVGGRVLQQSENGQWAESLDGGATWGSLQSSYTVTGPAILLAFDPERAGTLYRGDTGSGLWRSDDNGATWISLGVTLGARSHIEFAPGMPGLVWVSDDKGKVLVSGDFGATWTTAFTAPFASPCTDLDFSDELNALLIGTESASAWELPNASPYRNLGGGTLGSGSLKPRLFPTGDLPHIGSSGFGLAGDQTVGGAAALLGLSGIDLPTPLFGGTLHPSAPFVSVTSHALGGTPGLAGDGAFSLTLGIPSTVSLIGLEVVAQYAVLADPGASDPSGVVLSDGLAVTLLP